MITIDINKKFSLALVASDDLQDAHYEQLTDAHKLDATTRLPVPIRQYHTVANTVPAGLVTQERGFPKDGWERRNTGIW